MEEINWPQILDAVIIVLLGATIFYAARLSLYLRDFRAGKKDMDKLISSLADHIVRAEKAITGMRESARESGRDLQSLINEAKALSEELQFMGEAGNSLASRLETLAERSAKMAVAAKAAPRSRERFIAAKEDSFAIRDADFELEEDALREVVSDEPGLQSRAERELYEALQRSSGGKTRAGGVS